MKSTRMKLGVIFGVLVVMVVAASGLANAVNPFDDVPDGAFFDEPVDWAFNNGITTGKSDTKFAPFDNVTRGEVVTFIKRHDDLIQDALADQETSILTTGAAAFADRLGRMEIQDIDLALTKGETKKVGGVDGVDVNVTCADAGAGAVDIRVFVTSTGDGWYMPWFSTTVLSKTDVGEFIALGSGFASTTEFATWMVDGFAVRTPSGGYIAINAETILIIINPSVHSADCLFMGQYEYFG